MQAYISAKSAALRTTHSESDIVSSYISAFVQPSNWSTKWKALRSPNVSAKQRANGCALMCAFRSTYHGSYCDPDSSAFGIAIWAANSTPHGTAYGAAYRTTDRSAHKLP